MVVWLGKQLKFWFAKQKLRPQRLCLFVPPLYGFFCIIIVVIYDLRRHKTTMKLAVVSITTNRFFNENNHFSVSDGVWEEVSSPAECDALTQQGVLQGEPLMRLRRVLWGNSVTHMRDSGLQVSCNRKFFCNIKSIPRFTIIVSGYRSIKHVHVPKKPYANHKTDAKQNPNFRNFRRMVKMLSHLWRPWNSGNPVHRWHWPTFEGVCLQESKAWKWTHLWRQLRSFVVSKWLGRGEDV